MKVIISAAAEKKLERISKLDQIAIAQKIRALKEEMILSEEKLKGYDKTFKVRVGDYRIIYQRTNEQVYVILIGHRKDIYKLFNRLFK